MGRHRFTVISESDLQVVGEWLESKNAKCGVCEEALVATAQNTINVFVPTTGGGFELMRWGEPDGPTQRRRRDAMGWVRALIQPLRSFYLGGTHAARVVCDNCGNIVLLDAEKVGVWPPRDEDQQQEA